MISPEAFTIAIPDETLDHIRKKVANYKWHEMPDDGGWAYGTNLDYMKELCTYWLKTYDWRFHEASLNRFQHFRTPIDGIDIHFIHEKGSGPAPIPLLISHGWPGSVFEFQKIIEPIQNGLEAAWPTHLMLLRRLFQDSAFQDGLHGPSAPEKLQKFLPH